MHVQQRVALATGAEEWEAARQRCPLGRNCGGGGSSPCSSIFYNKEVAVAFQPATYYILEKALATVGKAPQLKGLKGVRPCRLLLRHFERDLAMREMMEYETR